MCIICIEYEMSLLTIREARRNLSEMRSSIDAEHVQEIENFLALKELEQLSEKDFRDEYEDIIADGSD